MNRGRDGGSFGSPASQLRHNAAFTDPAFHPTTAASFKPSLTSLHWLSTSAWFTSALECQVFKVKCNKRQLDSSRVTLGAAWGSCNAAESGADTGGHWDFKSELMNLLCCREKAKRKHPCRQCWPLHRQEFTLSGTAWRLAMDSQATGLHCVQWFWFYEVFTTRSKLVLCSS